MPPIKNLPSACQATQWTWFISSLNLVPPVAKLASGLPSLLYTVTKYPFLRGPVLCPPKRICPSDLNARSKAVSVWLP